ncbi:MAG: GNAT family N-acetyltransferase [Gammaproteobacteria bacterium]|nr:GNAT family N-acetyltransferase [Gammaproteobacteria bacterium]MDH5629515.1 GNAT family N-acetyltransferase [Gammaproteobacteria bacterium]
MKPYYIVQKSWRQASGDIIEIRQKVFVLEQRFARESICDNKEDKSIHILAYDNKGKPLGCGRLTETGEIGQIAVIMSARGLGIGSEILSKLITLARKKKLHIVSLNTETDLLTFYNHRDFIASGPVYMRQGVPFQQMTRKLA